MLILLAIGVLVSVSAISASIRERRAELAALRAIGFRRLRVALLITAESTALALAGTLLAVVPLFLLYNVRGLSLGPGPLSNIVVSATDTLLVIASAGIVGFLAGSLPSFVNSRRELIVDLNGL
jgi:ABC-type antimicrobial peptide transport system permease subunit